MKTNLFGSDGQQAEASPRTGLCDTFLDLSQSSIIQTQYPKIHLVEDVNASQLQRSHGFASLLQRYSS